VPLAQSHDTTPQTRQIGCAAFNQSRSPLTCKLSRLCIWRRQEQRLVLADSDVHCLWLLLSPKLLLLLLRQLQRARLTEV
jgi:hypothetical protein